MSVGGVAALLIGLAVPGSPPGWGAGDPAKREAEAKPLPLEEALAKARVKGKYRMLLRQIKVAKDFDTYKDFRDLGPRQVKDYGDQVDLPKAYWVYVYPYWYLWRDLADEVPGSRPWGPEQATGEPDTPQAGDLNTAWASLTPDGQDEWLLLEYATPVLPTAVLVHETFNPGALCRVTVFGLDGKEVEVWKGKDPTTPDKDRGVSEVPIKIDFKINRVKLYLDSPAVPGWNEIDAVGLRDKAGKVYWATDAEASSTYAENYPPTPPDRRDKRIRQLEAEVRRLKEANDELRQAVEELKERLKKNQ
jgi:hypothetical protein